MILVLKKLYSIYEFIATKAYMPTMLYKIFITQKPSLLIALLPLQPHSIYAPSQYPELGY